MAQVTINLPDDLYESLKRLAEASGEPLEEVISDWAQGSHEPGISIPTDDLDEFFRQLEAA